MVERVPVADKMQESVYVVYVEDRRCKRRCYPKQLRRYALYFAIRSCNDADLQITLESFRPVDRAARVED